MLKKDNFDSDKQVQTDKSPIIRFANFMVFLSVLCLIMSIIDVASVIVMAMYYLLLILAIIITLFLLLKTLTPWLSKGEIVKDFVIKFQPFIPYILIAGIGLGVISLIIYITQKNYIHRKSKIISTSVLLALFVVSIILRIFINKNVSF